MVMSAPTGGSEGGVTRDVTFRLNVETKELDAALGRIKKAQEAFRDAAPKANATREYVEGYAKAGKLIKEASADVDKLTKLEIKKAEKIAAELKKRLAEEDRARKKDFDDYVKHLNKKEAEEKRAADKAEREQKKITAALKREADQRILQHKRETDSFIAAKQREAAAAQAVASRGSLANTGGKLLSGGLDLGRGIALSGLIGEQDASKLLDTLLKIESTIATVRGGIDVYQGLAGSVRDYIQALRAAATAQEALRVAKITSDYGLTQGMASAAAGSAAGAAGGGGSVAGLGTIGGTAALGTAGSALVIVTGLVMSLITLKEQLDGTAAASEGMTGALMRFYAPFTDWLVSLGARNGHFGADKTRQMQDQLDYNRIGMNASARYQSTMDDVVSEARGKRWARLVENIMTDYSDKAFGQEDTGKLAENRLAQARLMKERRILTMFPGSGSASDRSNAEATVISANGKIISLLKEELSLTEQIANKSIEGSKERVKLLEDQKKIQKELAEEAKNRFMTGKERFGNMNQTDQQKLIQTQQAFKYASELDRRGDAGSRMQAERIRASISAEDRQKLAGLGLKEGMAFNQRAAMENANRSGFDDFFGGQEGRQFDRATKAGGAIDVKINNENQLIVNLQNDIATQKQSLMTLIRSEMDAARSKDLAAFESRLNDWYNKRSKEEMEKMSQRMRDDQEKFNKSKNVAL